MGHMGHVHSTSFYNPTDGFGFGVNEVHCHRFGVHCDDFEANAEHHQRGEDTQRPRTMGVEVPQKC